MRHQLALLGFLALLATQAIALVPNALASGVTMIPRECIQNMINYREPFVFGGGETIACNGLFSDPKFNLRGPKSLSALDRISFSGGGRFNFQDEKLSRAETVWKNLGTHARLGYHTYGEWAAALEENPHFLFPAGGGHGDPHYTRFKGFLLNTATGTISKDYEKFDFQGVGTFDLYSRPGLQVNGRTFQCGNNVSCNGVFGIVMRHEEGVKSTIQFGSDPPELNNADKQALNAASDVLRGFARRLNLQTRMQRIRYGDKLWGSVTPDSDQEYVVVVARSGVLDTGNSRATDMISRMRPSQVRVYLNGIISGGRTGYSRHDDGDGYTGEYRGTTATRGGYRGIRRDDYDHYSDLTAAARILSSMTDNEIRQIQQALKTTGDIVAKAAGMKSVFKISYNDHVPPKNEVVTLPNNDGWFKWETIGESNVLSFSSNEAQFVFAQEASGSSYGFTFIMKGAPFHKGAAVGGMMGATIDFEFVNLPRGSYIPPKVQALLNQYPHLCNTNPWNFKTSGLLRTDDPGSRFGVRGYLPTCKGFLPMEYQLQLP